MTADRLRQLVKKATAGPWEVDDVLSPIQDTTVRADKGRATIATIDDWRPGSEHNARLIAIAPELAALCADFAKWVDTVLAQGGPVTSDWAEGESLLERVERLGEPA